MAEVKKRGPGRPRKQPAKDPLPRVGLMDAPSMPDFIAEFKYDKPAILKKFSNYWGALNAESVLLSFRKDRLIIMTSEYKKTCYVRHTIDAKDTVAYYCKEPLDIVLLYSDFDLILQKLEKECPSIEFRVTERNRGKELNVIIGSQWEVPEFLDIDMQIDPTFVHSFASIFDETKYPLELSIVGKHFKKMVSEITSFDPKLELEYYKLDEKSTPVFKYRSQNNRVRGKAIPNRKAVLHDTVAQNDIFAVSMYANVLKPTSQAILADSLTMHVCDNKAFIKLTCVNIEKILIDIMISVIDHRPNA